MVVGPFVGIYKTTKEWDMKLWYLKVVLILSKKQGSIWENNGMGNLYEVVLFIHKSNLGEVSTKFL